MAGAGADRTIRSTETIVIVTGVISHGERHQSVLLEEVLQGLMIRDDGIYIDCTFGRGGHSRAMLQRLGDHGRVIAIDRDPEAIKAGMLLASEDRRFTIEQGPFSMLKEIAGQHSLIGKVNGVLFDLGVSSPQLDNATRGFSFMREGPLDMRMDPASGISAADWLATASEQEMSDVFKRYGEERFARRIARAIAAARNITPIETTRQLAEIVRSASPRQRPGEKAIHPATRVFQAIRIYINDELGEVKKALDQVLEVLVPGGRLAVISFHSLEDRIVKRFMKKAAQGDDFPLGMPVPVAMLNPTLKIIGRKIRASDKEIASNPRARSAVLRVAEKITGAGA